MQPLQTYFCYDSNSIQLLQCGYEEAMKQRTYRKVEVGQRPINFQFHYVSEQLEGLDGGRRLVWRSLSTLVAEAAGTLFPMKDYSHFDQHMLDKVTFFQEVNLLPPQYYKSIFTSTYFNPSGTYHIIAQINGHYNVVTIDDKIPVYEGTNQPLWGMSLDYPWQLILLKAWAYTNGGYLTLQNCNPFEFIRAFSYPNWKTKSLLKLRRRDLFTELGSLLGSPVSIGSGINKGMETSNNIFNSRLQLVKSGIKNGGDPFGQPASNDGPPSRVNNMGEIGSKIVIPVQVSTLSNTQQNNNLPVISGIIAPTNITTVDSQLKGAIGTPNVLNTNINILNQQLSGLIAPIEPVEPVQSVQPTIDSQVPPEMVSSLSQQVIPKMYSVLPVQPLSDTVAYKAPFINTHSYHPSLQLVNNSQHGFAPIQSVVDSRSPLPPIQPYQVQTYPPIQTIIHSRHNVPLNAVPNNVQNVQLIQSIVNSSVNLTQSSINKTMTNIPIAPQIAPLTMSIQNPLLVNSTHNPPIQPLILSSGHSVPPTITTSNMLPIQSTINNMPTFRPPLLNSSVHNVPLTESITHSTNINLPPIQPSINFNPPGIQYPTYNSVYIPNNSVQPIASPSPPSVYPTFPTFYEPNKAPAFFSFLSTNNGAQTSLQTQTITKFESVHEPPKPILMGGDRSSAHLPHSSNYTIIAATKNNNKILEYGLLKNSSSYRIVQTLQYENTPLLLIQTTYKHSWNGRFSVHDPKLSGFLSKEHISLSLNRSFIITLEDFLNIFNHVYLSFVNYSEIDGVRHTFLLDKTFNKSAYYHLKVDAPSRIDISVVFNTYLIQQKRNLRMKVAILKQLSGNMSRVQPINEWINIDQHNNMGQYDYRLIKETDGMCQNETFQQNYSSGDYILKVKMEQHGTPVDYVINVVSESSVSIRPITLDKENKREMLGSAILDYCSRHTMNRQYLSAIQHKGESSWIEYQPLSPFGFGYLAMVVEKRSKTNIVCKYNPALLKEQGFIIKGRYKKFNGWVEFCISAGQGYVLTFQKYHYACPKALSVFALNV